jgi:hypothetical protein
VIAAHIIIIALLMVAADNSGKSVNSYQTKWCNNTGELHLADGVVLWRVKI